MLLIDGKSVIPKQFCVDNGMDYDKIMANPVFELHKKYQKKDKANGDVIKVPAKVSLTAKTFIKLKSGAVVEMRYAENRNYRTVKNERIEVFTPRYISFDAVKKTAKNQDDLAVYMFANANNVSSPFGNGKNYDYQHLDPTSIAKTRMENLSNVSKAMALLEKMEEQDLLILAKGIQISFKQFNPFVDGYDTHVDIVRAEMMTFSQLNAKAFLELIDNKVAKTKGQIINLVDNGIIKIHESYNTRQWKWEKGERAGNPIGDQIIDPHADALDYLVNYVLSNLAEYMSSLNTVNSGLTAEEKALAYIKSQEYSKPVIEVTIDGLPTSYKESQEWLGENGFRKLPALAKRLNEGIESGQINTGNIHGMVKELDEQLKEENL